MSKKAKKNGKSKTKADRLAAAATYRKTTATVMAAIAAIGIAQAVEPAPAQASVPVTITQMVAPQSEAKLGPVLVVDNTKPTRPPHTLDNLWNHLMAHCRTETLREEAWGDRYSRRAA